MWCCIFNWFGAWSEWRRSDPAHGFGRSIGMNDARKKQAPTSQVITELDRLLRLAHSRGASDLHLEPTPAGLSVRLRLDGVLQDVETLPTALARPIVARVKFLADLLTYRTDIPQEGRLRAEDAVGAGDLRVSTFPTIHGERVVIRFFGQQSAAVELTDLHLPPAVLEGLSRAISGTSGVVLLTGPAGSGKTTTLYAAINTLVRTRAHRPHVITVEDPVESVLDGVTQTQINTAAGLTYAVVLRSLLRQDPEVLMVGEIRDRETAEIVAQAGLTGHLVLSTLHGGDIATVLTRLLEMGLEPYVVSSSLRAVLGMRLVRHLCEGCRRPGPRVTVMVGGRGQPTATFVPAGCQACGGTGYRGRLPVVEFAEIGPDLRKCILASADSEAIARQLAAEQVRMLLERGLELVETGSTSLDELRRVLGPIDLLSDRA